MQGKVVEILADNSNLFKNLVIKYIINDLQQQGFQLNNAFGKAIFVSNKIKPHKFAVVISTKKRDDVQNKLTIDLTEEEVFIEWFEKLEGVVPKRFEFFPTNIDLIYSKLVGLPLITEDSYSNLIKHFLVEFVPMQPLDQDKIDFINKYFYLFDKFVIDLLGGDIVISSYYNTILTEYKKNVIKLADILLKCDNPYDFILEYDLKASQ